MIPGPNEIYKCPNCNNLLSRGSLLSGNTFVKQVYSDGKIISKMLPEFPSITKCSKCESIFWIRKLQKVGSSYRGKNQGEWENAEDVKFLSVYDYKKSLDDGIYETKDELLFIRLRILWGFNDRVRDGHPLLSNDLDEMIWKENINELLELLDDKESNKLLISELHRNLGQFDISIKVLNSIKNPKLDWEKSEFEKHCKMKDKLVFELDYMMEYLKSRKNLLKKE
jgi:hypothetical protein